MRHEIIVAPDADEALRRIRAYERVAVLEAIERHLRFEPTKTSKSRIKAIRGMSHPQYRLRIGGLRVFYDVRPGQVEVVAVVSKQDAATWLSRWGVSIDEERGLP